MQTVERIQNHIYELRGEKVLLDRDLAVLYEVETRVLNQAVKRNLQRFPSDFMFQLTVAEWQWMQQLFAQQPAMSSQVVMTYPNKRPISALPYAFTEQGIAMLSGVLKSDKAIQMNIAIMRAFVAIRRVLTTQTDIKEQLKQIKERLGGHDAQLSQIYEAMESLLHEKAAQTSWEERQRIGFNR